MGGQESLSGRLVRFTLRSSITGLARVARILHPQVERFVRARNVPYGDAALPERRLDVYASPWLEPSAAPPPAVLYIHGGGFQILDKESHWVFGYELARAGFVVFMIDYRLAPRHPFPAACEDVAQAYAWLARHAGRYGADPGRIIVAGDSAGANLALGLCLACAHDLPGAPWTRPLRQLAPPRGAVLLAGLLQVTSPGRFALDGKLARVARSRLHSISANYSSGHPPHPMLDPLSAVEQGLSPGCPVFASVGGRDPIRDDTLRLARALELLGADFESEVMPDAGHVFQALYWNDAAQRSWSRMRAFLAARGLDGAKLGGGHAESTPSASHASPPCDRAGLE